MMKKYLFICGLLALSACASHEIYEDAGGQYRTSQSFYMEKGIGHYKVGKPYQIFGIWYYPKEDYNYVETGVASWYGEDFHAKDTANGEEYDMNTMTAAHRTLPLPSVVKVTNLENGKTAIFRVNDRGPFAKDRIIDISKKGAQVLDFHTQGTTKVKVEILPEESIALKEALTGKPNQTTYNKTTAPKTTYIKRASQSDDYLQPISSNGIVHSTVEAAADCKFYVQAGAFNKESGAIATKDQLSSIENVAIYPANIGNGQFYRVRVGPFNTQQEADAVLTQVKNMGIINAKTIQD